MAMQVKNNVAWVGKIDWELEQFHGSDYSIQHGSSQNAYLVREGKTVLVDTVWAPHSTEFVDNLKREIDLSLIDCIVANHGEVDHSGALPALLEEIPGTPIYCTANAVKSLVGQYHCDDWNFHVVKTGDSLDIGNGKRLVFVEMRMLHWPDSMATYLTGDNILFSNDAFGQHYAVEGLFDDKADPCLLEQEAMKYYANILTPFATLAKRKLAEIVGMGLPVEMIAPSHGAIWRKSPGHILERYIAWSDEYREDRITVVYDTMWDGTMTIAHAIADAIRTASPSTTVKLFDISRSDKNEIMTEVFRSKAIAVGSPTVGGNVLSSVGGWLCFLEELKFKGKKAGVFGCYGWSGEGTAVLRKKLEESGFSVIDEEIKCNWNPRQTDLDKTEAFCEALCR
jgi:flavorubredoxin